MTAHPRTSVVIAARDAEETIAETLGSLLAQSVSDWEALIVDDGSNDGTAAIVAEHAARDSRFRLLNCDGAGASSARNKGISNARGERILFLDSDDWIDRSFLARMNAALDLNSSAVAAYCNGCRVMPDGGETPVRVDPTIQDNAFERFARTCATFIHTVLVLKSAVAKVGGFETSLRTCEDWDLWQRIARCGGRWIHVDEKLSYYRISDRSLTQDVKRMLADAQVVIARGFSSDDRVGEPAPAHQAGASIAYGTAAAAYAYFVLWCAGFDCGRRNASDPSLEALSDIPKTQASADDITTVLLDAVMVGARTVPAKLAERWPQYGNGVTSLISAIARAWNDRAAGRKCQYRFERKVLDYDDLSAPRVLTLTLGTRVDLRHISTIRPIGTIDRLYVYLCDGPRILTLVDIGVLGTVGRRFWITLAADGLVHLQIKDQIGNLVRAKIALHKRAGRLRSFVRDGRDTHRGRLRELDSRASREARSLAISGIPASSSRMRGAERSQEPGRKQFWEGLFEQEDPWNYGSPYEQEKYIRQLELLPDQPVENALELACAEGHFTRQLARRVKRLRAADISTKALDRARVRCNGHQNIEFAQLDLATDPLPQDIDLIVCSEALYYLDDEAELELVAKRLAQALRPGGYLVAAHAFVLKDNMSRTGLDWESPYGAETITRTIQGVPGLALDASIETELYRIDRFRRLRSGEATPDAQVKCAAVNAPIEVKVARSIVWGGAAARRFDVTQSERRAHAPVLMYHRIAAEGPGELARYRVSPDAFRQQMLWLRRNGYHTINSDQLAWFVANDHPFVGRPVLITFDDGYEDFAEHAWPILQANDFSAEVFVATDFVGKRAEWDAPLGEPASLLDMTGIAALAAEGVCFGSHLASHPRSEALATWNLAEELTRSRAQLEQWLGRPITSLAAPFGATDQRLEILAAECGYKTLFSTVSRAATLKDNLLNLPRIEVRGEFTLDAFARCLEQYQ
ncbi:trifunctional glycosyltransferase/class I SAM-dependent methyltransferase/polysaccharide deacetylase [Bradyrhizobium sp. CB82]|uniref:trifunctional glycosyltransferase/class I SAM-dependent methyltransferase/polysaccharide deacetylase n=1 Tax=Bradyrhizobium sp. CB82 TaxID=3039159 RepID=UPI0024B26828|nr:trifunctional glycosyltransferase/class I SAM-dependent methyltransferase/polysaccharide deacetylase [Bradyrhizobium sp. CB82]WFU39382.1 trifunctional glycosyltransferase/class I SAM-dependent methyltransferase/polysaccharide deacetylase [Bradyrhizobium sp. CB82]